MPSALPRPTVPLRRKAALLASWKPLLLNWLLPGLGYWRIGERRRALILASVTAIFLFLAWLQLAFGGPDGLRGGVYVPRTDPFEWMPTLGALATTGVGPIYAVFAGAFGGTGAEPVRALTQEYGASYLMVAGLLNWLCTFDLFDRLTGRWFWRLPEDEREPLMPIAETEASRN